MWTMPYVLATPHHPRGTSPERRLPDVLAAEFGTGEVLWSIVWLYFFLILIRLLAFVFADIVQSPDLPGIGKAGWSLLVIVLPYLGILVYLVVRGQRMRHDAAQFAGDTAGWAYPPPVARTGVGDELDAAKSELPG